MRDNIHKAFYEGQRAIEVRTPTPSNSYLVGSPEHAAWDCGYHSWYVAGHLAACMWQTPADLPECPYPATTGAAHHWIGGFNDGLAWSRENSAEWTEELYYGNNHYR